MSYILLSLDGRQILVPARLLHPHRRTHQVHIQVKQQSVVMIGHQETGAIHQTIKTKRKRGTTMAQRETDCETIQKWSEECTENLKDTEVPPPAHNSHDSDSERPANVASRKYSILLTSQKDRNCEPKLQGLLAEDALAKQCLEQKSLVT